MPTNLDQARSAIASEIGPDVAEFTPTGEKHFVAEAALMEIAGSFLYAFFKGVMKKATETVEDKTGEAIGDAAVGLLNRLLHKEPPVSDKELQAEQASAKAAVQSQGLSQAEIDAIGTAVAAAITAALAKRSDLDITKRVVDRVKEEGLQAISQGA